MKVLKLHDLYYFNLAVLGHDYFHSNTLPTKLSEKLCKHSDTATRTTRNTDNNLWFNTPHNTLAARKPSAAISAYWNSLPVELKTCKSRNSFKIKLKDHYIENY